AGDAIGNQLAEKVRYFVERGCEVRVYAASTEHLHPRVSPYCAKLQSDPWRDHAERRYLRQSDLIIAEYGVYYDLLNLLPVLATGKPRIVIDYHGVTPRALWDASERHRLEPAERRRGVVWCADAVIAHSQFTSEELHRTSGYPRERIGQLPCMVDLDQFNLEVSTRNVRSRLGLNDAIVLLFVGRLAANKRVPLLVEAVRQLAESSPAVHAVILGDDNDIYAGEAEACRRLAERLHVSDRVHLLGSVDQATLLAWYHSSDVLVIPSRHEGFCLPVAEAMACGLPIVA